MRRPFTLGKWHLTAKLLSIFRELQSHITSWDIICNVLSQYWKLCTERKGCVRSAHSLRIQSFHSIFSEQNEITEFFWGHIYLVRAQESCISSIIIHLNNMSLWGENFFFLLFLCELLIAISIAGVSNPGAVFVEADTFAICHNFVKLFKIFIQLLNWLV